MAPTTASLARLALLAHMLLGLPHPREMVELAWVAVLRLLSALAIPITALSVMAIFRTLQRRLPFGAE